MFQQLKANLNPMTDGTYTMQGNPTRFASGYQVLFERPDDEYNDNLFDTIVISLCAHLQSMVYIGVWGGSKEVSFHTESRELALGIAFKYKQDAIWDWANNQAITLK